MSRQASHPVHAISFDDRTFGISIDPGHPSHPHDRAVHLLALAMAATQLTRVARETAERASLDDQGDSLQKVHALLVGGEVLGSLIEALSSEIVDATASPVPCEKARPT